MSDAGERRELEITDLDEVPRDAAQLEALADDDPRINVDGDLVSIHPHAGEEDDAWRERLFRHDERPA